MNAVNVQMGMQESKNQLDLSVCHLNSTRNSSDLIQEQDHIQKTLSCVKAQKLETVFREQK